MQHAGQCCQMENASIDKGAVNMIDELKELVSSQLEEYTGSCEGRDRRWPVHGFHEGIGLHSHARAAEPSRLAWRLARYERAAKSSKAVVLSGCSWGTRIWIVELGFFG